VSLLIEWECFALVRQCVGVSLIVPLDLWVAPNLTTCASPHWSPVDLWIEGWLWSRTGNGNGDGLLDKPWFPVSPWRSIYLSTLKQILGWVDGKLIVHRKISVTVVHWGGQAHAPFLDRCGTPHLLTELLAYDDLQVTPTGVRGYSHLADDDPWQGWNTARWSKTPLNWLLYFLLWNWSLFLSTFGIAVRGRRLCSLNTTLKS
jgi:hypothetical protein